MKPTAAPRKRSIRQSEVELLTEIRDVLKQMVELLQVIDSSTDNIDSTTQQIEYEIRLLQEALLAHTDGDPPEGAA
jgi:hypothetical protein